jgi:hypothetical protein
MSILISININIISMLMGKEREWNSHNDKRQLLLGKEWDSYKNKR